MYKINLHSKEGEQSKNKEQNRKKVPRCFSRGTLGVWIHSYNLSAAAPTAAPIKAEAMIFVKLVMSSNGENE
jgi:hypothetical protein